jgi:hypothetical protein
VQVHGNTKIERRLISDSTKVRSTQRLRRVLNDISPHPTAVATHTTHLDVSPSRVLTERNGCYDRKPSPLCPTQMSAKSRRLLTVSLHEKGEMCRREHMSRKALCRGGRRFNAKMSWRMVFSK